MGNIKELEITKELYNKALEINLMILSEDEEEMNRGCKLSKDFNTKHRFSIFDVIIEYQRREKNADKPLNELQEKDKNIYRITFVNGKILEMKVKCIGCAYNEEINQVLTIDYNLKNSGIETDAFSSVETIECIERNNNTDLNKDEKWWLKFELKQLLTWNELSVIINLSNERMVNK